MSKFFLLTKKTTLNMNRAGQKMNHQRRRVKVNLKVLNLIIFSLVAIIGLAYLIEVNSLATKGYRIGELEVKIDQLQQESKDLELQVLELQSIESVKNKVSQLNMVSGGKVEYLISSPVAIAR